MTDLAPVDIKGSATPAAPEPTGATATDQQPLTAIPTEHGHVALVDTDGQVMSVPAENAIKAVRQYGYRPATDDEWTKAKMGGTAGQIGSAAIGAGQSVSGGFLAPAVIAAADAIGGESEGNEYRRAVRLARETNPGAYLAGELGGALVPVGGGAAGKATSLLGRVAEAAPHAAGLGAVYGLGEQATEDAIENKGFNASAYLSSGLKGGLMGLLLGTTTAAGLGAIGDKVASLRSAAPGIERAAIEEGEVGGGLASRELGANPETELLGRSGLVQPTEAATDVEFAAQGKLGAKSWLESQADKQAFKATGAKAGDIRRLGATVEEQQAEMERIGARLRNETLEGKPLIEATTSQAEIAKRVTAKADEVGKGLGQMRAELDKQSKIRPSMNDIVERFESEVGQPASAMPLGEKDVAAARAYLEDMVAKGGEQPTFDTLYKYRRRLDDKLDKEYARAPGLPSAAGADAMHALRAIVEDEFTKAGERAAGDIGSEFASKYKLTKELYADLATARDIATPEAARNAGANFISLTDAVIGAAGGIHGLAAMAANQVRRKYGNQIASHVLGSASKLFPVQDAALKMDAALNKGAKAFVASEKAATRATKRVTSDEVREIRNAVRSPEAITARVETALGDLPKYAPKLSTQMATRAATIASYLRDNLPKESPPATMAFGPPKKRPLSDSDLIRAGHIIETAVDPSVIVDRLNEGRLTRDHVAALKGAHPDVYAKIETYLQQHGTELREQLPVQKQVLLSLLFGQPITDAMLPANISAFQASFVGGSQGPGKGGAPGGAPPPPPPGNPINIGSGGNIGTALDQLERGEA